MAHLLLLNGPNLNLLGTREPGLYGAVTLEQISARLAQLAAEFGHHLSSFQSNAEAELITRIHEAPATHVAFNFVFNVSISGVIGNFAVSMFCNFAVSIIFYFLACLSFNIPAPVLSVVAVIDHRRR